MVATPGGHSDSPGQASNGLIATCCHAHTEWLVQSAIFSFQVTYYETLEHLIGSPEGRSGNWPSHLPGWL